MAPARPFSAGLSSCPSSSKPPAAVMDLAARQAALANDMDLLEAEALHRKHWALTGEVQAEDRPKNSLLATHLEVTKATTTATGGLGGEDPMDMFAAQGGIIGEKEQRSGDEEEEEGERAPPRLSERIEGMIRQRIVDLAFDDVVRQAQSAPANKEHSQLEAEKEVLDFQKSRVGLGEVYAREFEKEFLGQKSVDERERDQKTDEARREVTSIFAKLMYKLDSLCNQRFTPRPPTGLGGGGAPVGVSAICVEDTVPLVMSGASMATPGEEHNKSRNDETKKQPEDMTQEERRALRGANKARRKKKLQGRLVGGELSLGGLRERQQKLRIKNSGEAVVKSQPKLEAFRDVPAGRRVKNAMLMN
eukprot:GHVS01092601.1.p1 GENE.GHVS01092601.1~~GHVS01092601.1.p1  ORF type:complete len:362 (+),score=93.93 GHVS01092601.1:165-1250(+)